MKVELENRKLEQAANLLFHLALKGKQSRHRTKFIKLLQARIEEVEEQRIQLAKEHSNLDEEGNPIVKNNKFDIKDLDAFSKDLEELYDEKMVIEGGDYTSMLKTLKEVLLTCEVEFSGKEAVLYDYLCEQFEGGENE
ncbi:DUF1617 family protein [Caldibacillus lycopersici]|uniref:DUF1617 family protein n=1 Tax=Perspicuibacillus lycopersici TaxID=1325689 RepID=A0AAE3ITA8_9BACI|nr:DUF1617 family protein [Perspicuibacillus lycopersici]MCU9614071.1 DUF1617 family protein [Perspicuibacillus lycopersici]